MIWGKVQHRFQGFHHWSDAGAKSANHKHLGNRHRHLFHVSVWFEQFHSDRDIEYLEFRDWLEEICSGEHFNDLSCEMIAQQIHTLCLARWGGSRRYKVEVMEDGENGALYE